MPKLVYLFIYIYFYHLFIYLFIKCHCVSGCVTAKSCAECMERKNTTEFNCQWCPKTKRSACMSHHEHI